MYSKNRSDKRCFGAKTDRFAATKRETNSVTLSVLIAFNAICCILLDQKECIFIIVNVLIQIERISKYSRIFIKMKSNNIFSKRFLCVFESLDCVFEITNKRL